VMTKGANTDELLEILRSYNIQPYEEELPESPEVGMLNENESIYQLRMGPRENLEVWPGEEESRLREWRNELRSIILDSEGAERAIAKPRKSVGDAIEDWGVWPPRRRSPEPRCAWYCPLHFYGHGWGIYIREECILAAALDIARFINWKRLSEVSSQEQESRLLRAAFYVFFLHEQFHHKVESLGFRLLVSTGGDRYRPYKNNIYRPSLGTPFCLEESLANADSYLRLSERRYSKRLSPPVSQGLRNYLKDSFPRQAPGYAEAIHYLNSDRFQDTLNDLQSMVRDCDLPARSSAGWSIAPGMTTALMNIESDLYVVLPKGARPLFRPLVVDPGHTVSTDEMVKALEKHWGYELVAGGKGSHVKLKKNGANNIHLKGAQKTLSPGLVRQVLRELGGYAISQLSDVLEGKVAD
jgi:predicted RNA binding protein YcfA (HicA-like mRNA interferase family)